jgi:hypothetical protein
VGDTYVDGESGLALTDAWGILIWVHGESGRALTDADRYE